MHTTLHVCIAKSIRVHRWLLFGFAGARVHAINVPETRPIGSYVTSGGRKRLYGTVKNELMRPLAKKEITRLAPARRQLPNQKSLSLFHFPIPGRIGENRRDEAYAKHRETAGLELWTRTTTWALFFFSHIFLPLVHVSQSLQQLLVLDQLICCWKSITHGKIHSGGDLPSPHLGGCKLKQGRITNCASPA